MPFGAGRRWHERHRRSTCRQAAGAVPIPALDRDAWVVGATYWPEPDIAVKVDYVIQRSQSTVITARNAFNVGLGWWF